VELPALEGSESPEQAEGEEGARDA